METKRELKAAKEEEEMKDLANIAAERYAEKPQTLEEIAEEMVAEAKALSALATQFADSVDVEVKKQKYLQAQMSLFDLGEEV